MGIFNNFLDRFKATDFHLAPNKKIKTIQSEFNSNFGLTLRVYKGKMLADPSLTFAQLNNKTSKNVNSSNIDLKIKANLNIGDFEKLIDTHFGVTVQVANEFDTYCVNNKYTLGQASRKEDLLDRVKYLGFNSIEEWLKSENYASLNEYYKMNLK